MISTFTHTLDWSLVDAQLSKLDRFLALECCVQRGLRQPNLRVGSGVAEISVLANASTCEAPRAQLAKTIPQFTHIGGCADVETRPKLVGRITATDGETPSTRRWRTVPVA